MLPRFNHPKPRFDNIENNIISLTIPCESEAEGKNLQNKTNKESRVQSPGRNAHEAGDSIASRRG